MAEKMGSALKTVPRNLSYEAVAAKLSYDPETGIITRRIDMKEAGGINDEGYRRLRLHGLAIKAHHVAWMLFYKEWPPQELDHINRDRADNRIVNLRLATRSINVTNKVFENRGIRKTASGRWSAQTRLGGKIKHLGTFDTAELASRAIEAALQAEGDA